MNSYDLSRSYWDFAFENPDKVKPIHAAMFFFAIEHCNRLGWKSKFGFPTSMVKEAIGVKSFNTYKKIFNDLVDWGFFELIQESKNQYSSNIIALSINDKALDKSLDKALIKHGTKQTSKQSESTVQSTGSINKPLNKEQGTRENPRPTLSEFLDYAKFMCPQIRKDYRRLEPALTAKFHAWNESGWVNGLTGDPIWNWKSTLMNTIPNLKESDESELKPLKAKRYV